MRYKTYQVKVYDEGHKLWHLEEKLHREDGPAVEWADGSKEWYLNDNHYTEAECQAEMNKRNPSNCEGKVVEIDGKKYTLTEV